MRVSLAYGVSRVKPLSTCSMRPASSNVNMHGAPIIDGEYGLYLHVWGTDFCPLVDSQVDLRHEPLVSR